jgi:hypothetical protein
MDPSSFFVSFFVYFLDSIGVATYGRREFSRPFDSTEDHWTIQGVAAVDDCAQAKKSAAP